MTRGIEVAQKCSVSSRLANFENLPYHWLTGKTIGKISLPVKILVKN